MKTFRLGCAVTVSAFTDVEAETLEAAIALAELRDVVLGGIGRGEDPSESWVIEDADGEPTDVHAVED